MEKTQFFLQRQPIVSAQLSRSIRHGRLAHAYLFSGDRGTGKHQIALWLAKSLYCLDSQDGQPCEKCNNCTRIEKGIHPDVIVIEPDGQSIKVDQIRHLQAELSRSGFEAEQRVFIIKEAEKMNNSAANSLLKFLEEPAGKNLAILETPSLGRILPTIQSRCQVLYFQALSTADLTKLLEDEGIGHDTADLLSALTNSFDKAVEIYQNEWFNEARESIQQWFDYLISRDKQAFIYVQKRLVKVFKEKPQQAQGITMLLYFFQRHLKEAVEKNQPAKLEQANESLRLVLEAEQKLASNVSFQNTAEQLAIRITGMIL